MTEMPALYIPHGGGPCFFMDWDPPDMWNQMADYLRAIPSDIGRLPKAIVVISAHWEEEIVTIQNNSSPALLYDYYGFPESTYQIEYPAPGTPDISEHIAGLRNRVQAGLPF